MSYSSSNKRIAKNTIYMYIRLLVTMAIGLYTSRIVINILGISNYGLFNVVGAVLGLFGFLSGSLGAATSRFFNYEMGREGGDVNRSFNINLMLHVCLALIVIFLAETIGLWYIYNKLNVAEGQFGDALFIYQLSIVTVALGIINGPYASLLIAHEKFKFLTNFDIINTIFRLFCIILLQYYKGDVLRIYAVLMSFTTINSFVVYHWIAKKKWAYIVKYKFIKGWVHYRNVLSFSAWNVFATLAMMARGTGCDLILNLFFGTAINGAFAIAKTINNYVMSFSSNFDGASAPQIVQSYSSNNLERCNYLVNKLGRFSLLLFELIFFPLYIELDFILHLWLKNVPPNVLVFCQLNLILAAVALTCGGIVQYINASGKIKWFKLNGGFFFVICIPISYICFKFNAPPYIVIVLFIIADIVQRIIQLILMRTILGFDSLRYIREAYFKPFIIAVIMSSFLYLHSFIDIENIYFKFASIITCFFLTTLTIYFIGLSKGERKKTKNLIFAKLGLNK